MMWSSEAAGGFFEGEGCIRVERHKGVKIAHNVALLVGQKDVRPLLQLERLFGGAILARPTAGDYMWRLYGKKAARALVAMLPWLIGKRSQALAALEFQTLMLETAVGRIRTDSFGRIPIEITAERDAYVTLLQELKVVA